MCLKKMTWREDKDESFRQKKIHRKCILKISKDILGQIVLQEHKEQGVSERIVEGKEPAGMKGTEIIGRQKKLEKNRK